MFGFEFKMGAASERRLKRTLQRAPQEIKDRIIRKWSESCLKFLRLMHDKHLTGGTTVDRLAVQGGMLHKAMYHEVIIKGKDVNASVWFDSAVADYVPTHEYGDPSRNIPARMNLRREWKKFRPTFIRDAEDGISEGLRNA